MVRASCILASCALIAVLLVIPAFGYPSSNMRQENTYDPEEMVELLNRLNSIIQFERSVEGAKRALDLGLSRGYSGTIQAKHLMGIAAANYAGGPGRRRRDAAN